MFRRKHPVSKLSEAVTVIRDMSADVRSMFDEIEKLMRLLLVCPCSSAEAERSFSSLRRLKTWLRSTMSQKRLNSVAVCHTHQELLDETDITKLMRYFVNEIDTRVHVFGRI
jgi:hAT family C-terminal dimerisation region